MAVKKKVYSIPSRESSIVRERHFGDSNVRIRQKSSLSESERRKLNGN